MPDFRKRMKWPDLVVGIALLAVTVCLALFTLPPSSAMQVGLPSWLFPLVSLYLAGFCAVILIVMAFIPSLPGSVDMADSLDAAARVAAPILMVVIAVILIPFIGMVFVSPVLIAALMLWMGERSVVSIVLTAVGIPLLTATFAYFVLATPLP